MLGDLARREVESQVGHHPFWLGASTLADHAGRHWEINPTAPWTTDSVKWKPVYLATRLEQVTNQMEEKKKWQTPVLDLKDLWCWTYSSFFFCGCAITALPQKPSKTGKLRKSCGFPQRSATLGSFDSGDQNYHGRVPQGDLRSSEQWRGNDGPRAALTKCSLCQEIGRRRGEWVGVLKFYLVDQW